MLSELLSLSLLMITIRAAVPLLYATLGELLTERSGVINLGAEGIMALGAVVGFTVDYYTNNVWSGVFAAMLIGSLLGLIHSLLVITFKSDQVVAGLVMVTTCLGLASFLGQRLGPGGKSLVGLEGPQLEPSNLPGLFSQDPLTYLCFLFLVGAWVYIYLTRPGLELRAVGESPETADSSGVNIFRVRYLHTIVGAALIAIGGAYLPLAFSPGWSEGITDGRGFIAIGLVIVSRWNPLTAIFGAIVFGGINAFQYKLQAVGTTIPSALLRMLPFATAILVLILATIREKQEKEEPAALGQAYTRE